MKQIFIVFFCITALICNGQKTLKIESKIERNKVIIYSETVPKQFHTVIIHFSRLENSMHPTCQYFVINHSGTITILSPIKENEEISYSYTYTYSLGNADKEPDKDFIYRLPYSAGISRKSLPINYIQIGKNEQPEDFYNIFFQMEKGDTVFAARKGIIVEIVNDQDPLDIVGSVSYRNKSNSIAVEHKDGTIARYNVLEKNSMMVKEGDVVYPNTPIALAGTYNNIDYQVRFVLTHLTLSENYKEIESKKKFIYKYIKPVFNTTERTDTLHLGKRHTAVITPDMLQKEMNKKEVKKISENKK